LRVAEDDIGTGAMKLDNSIGSIQIIIIWEL
jgi:hypothetical protein